MVRLRVGSQAHTPSLALTHNSTLIHRRCGHVLSFLPSFLSLCSLFSLSWRCLRRSVVCLTTTLCMPTHGICTPLSTSQVREEGIDPIFYFSSKFTLKSDFSPSSNSSSTYHLLSLRHPNISSPFPLRFSLYLLQWDTSMWSLRGVRAQQEKA